VSENEDSCPRPVSESRFLMDAQLKAGLKNWASKWKIEQLIKLGRPAGHVKLSMKREDIIDAMEKLIEEFNSKQNSNPTIDKCFLEVGQDIFNDDLDGMRSAFSVQAVAGQPRIVSSQLRMMDDLYED
jgi:hypothetical protein